MGRGVVAGELHPQARQKRIARMLRITLRIILEYSMVWNITVCRKKKN
jgi:hypothetical protein